MRVIANKANLPGPMHRALSVNTYVGGGDSSATRLIAPPRIVVLRKYHEDEIEEDASDRIWSLLGSSVHRMLELSVVEDTDVRTYRQLQQSLTTLTENGLLDEIQQENFQDILDEVERKITPSRFIQNTVVEKRLYMPVQGIEKDGELWTWKVSMQSDVYEQKTIYDYKVTSLWSVLYGEKPEWDRQVNIQTAIHRYNGDEVEQAFIVVVMRDWQKSKSRYERDYPKTAVAKISIPLWSFQEQKDYIQRRVKLHQQAELDFLNADKDSEVLPMCSDEERWYRGHCFAVKFQDAKGKVNVKAKRKCKSIEEAKQFMRDFAPNLPKGKIFAPIEERKGENIRCESYCDVWFACAFGRKVHEEMEAKAMAKMAASPAENSETEEE